MCEDVTIVVVLFLVRGMAGHMSNHRSLVPTSQILLVSSVRFVSAPYSFLLLLAHLCQSIAFVPLHSDCRPCLLGT